MKCYHLVGLYYQRQQRNIAIGITETPVQIAEGVRQDLATAHRALQSERPAGAIEKALEDYPAGSGKVKSIAGISV